MPNVDVLSKTSKPSDLSVADLEMMKKMLKKKTMVDALVFEGGPGSGHWGHAGRKGQVGGSRTGGVGSALDFDKTSPGERMRMANYGDISRQMSSNLAGIRVGKAKYTEVQGNVTVGVARTIGKNMKAELSTYANYLAGDTVDLGHKYISMTEQTIERNTGAFKNVDAEVLNKLGVDCVRKLVHQEIESNRAQFTDHGIRHVVKNTMDQSAMLDQMAKGGVKVSARERLLANFIMVNHGIGYTTPMIRSGGMNAIKGAKEHPAYSKRIAGQQEGKWNLGKVFSKKEYARALNVIATHDATILDARDPVATATRMADNLSLFQKEKLPSMFRYVPGSQRTLVAMGIAAKKKNTKAFEKYRDQLHARIDKSDRLSGNLKRDLKRAVAEISYVTPKFTLGVLAGEVSKIGSSANAMVSVTVKYNKFDSTLQKMFDMGQKQTKKFLEDYGEKDFSKKSYLLGAHKGKAILQLKIEGVSSKGLKEIIESIKDETFYEVCAMLLEGGPGSGHWDHAGRKGERGGSAPGGGLGGGSVEQELAKRFAKQIQKMEGMKAGTEIELGRQVIEGNVINHATLAVYSDGEVLLYGGYFKGAPGDFSKHETAKYVVGNVEPKGGRIGGPPPTDIPDKVPWKKAGKDGAQKALFSKAKITGSKEEVKMVEDTLSQLPENHLSIAGKRVKNIEVADSKTILNEYAKQWPLPYGAEAYGMNGFYDQGTGRLMVTNSKLGLLHEFAHAVHYSSREIVDNIQQKIWRNGGAEGLINDYATTDMAESFAEGYRYFAVQNTDLKSSAPVVWSEMGKMFSKGLKD